MVVALVSLCLALLLALWAVPHSALADPSDIDQAKSEAEQLREAVEQANEELEVAVERYNGARYQLSLTETALEESAALLAATEADLAAATDKLNTRVASIYRNGRMGLLEAIFSARSFSDLVNRFEMLLRVGQSDAEMLSQVEAYTLKVKATKEQLATDQQQQAALLAEADSYGAQVSAMLAERQELLAGKEAEVERLIQEEEERQRLLAEQRAAEEAAAQAAEQQAAELAQQSPGTSAPLQPASVQPPATSPPATSAPETSSGGSQEEDSGDPQPALPSGSGSAVVDIAMQYLGVPYVWGGASPRGFDCSGLVTYVFAQLGVNLPHFAAAQFQYGTLVARENLQPGDLVFFGSNLHHVGIYVGDGNMIHAPYTGAVVRINSMGRSDYAGARRII